MKTGVLSFLVRPFVWHDVWPQCLITRFLGLKVDKARFVSGIIWELMRGQFGITLSRNPCVYDGLPLVSKEYDSHFTKEALKDYKSGISQVFVLVDRSHPIEVQLKAPGIPVGNVWKLSSMLFVLKGGVLHVLYSLKIFSWSKNFSNEWDSNGRQGLLREK